MNARSVFAGMIMMTGVAAGTDVPLVKPTAPANIAEYMQVFPAGPDVRNAAAVHVTADPNKAGDPVAKASDAERASNGAAAAVMAVVGKVLPVAQPAERRRTWGRAAHCFQAVVELRSGLGNHAR